MALKNARAPFAGTASGETHPSVQEQDRLI